MRARWAACVLAFGIAAAAQAAIWPDQFGQFKKSSSQPVAVEDRALWDENGFDQAEQATYAAGTRQFTGTAYRLKDPTGAFAIFEWQRPAEARASNLGDVSVSLPDGVLVLFGNYVIRFEGWKPQPEDLQIFLPRLPRLDRSSLPVLHLPSRGLIPNSERYATGPTGLDRFEKGVPPAVAAFSQGAEAQIAQYKTAAGPMQMAVFTYPTPQIAAQRLDSFENLPGAMAKRVGTLVAVILAPGDANAAERLLATVKYNGILTVSERVPTRKDNVGDMLVNIFALTGIILGMFVIGGLAFGLLRRFVWGTAGDAMTVLHIEDHSR